MDPYNTAPTKPDPWKGEPVKTDRRVKVNTVWQALVAYKNSREYTLRVVSAFALRATLTSKWSAM